MNYIIKDWANNRIKPSKFFESFEDAWDHILGELTDELSLNDEDYQEYFVETEEEGA
jgi:hypothetical protein